MRINFDETAFFYPHLRTDEEGNVLISFTMPESLTRWKLLGFVCQRQYRELKRICESGTAAELQAFLTAHPGAQEYIVYTRKGTSTSLVTSLFRLPSPLDVAGHANNLAVIPILLANGASPEVRSVSAAQSPAEEAIGTPEKMRALCDGKTWWLECSAKMESLEASIKENNHRGIIWNVMRGARLNSSEQLYKRPFLRLTSVMKEFICLFGIDEEQRRQFYAELKALPQEKVNKITTYYVKGTIAGYKNATWKTNFEGSV